MLAFQQFGIWRREILVQSLQSQGSPTSSMDFELYLVFRDIFTPNRKVG
jgi:hypothetical protein